MADKVSMALAELVRKAEANGDVDFLKEGVRVLRQALMEVEVAQHLGAERYERSGDRSGQRNGYRERNWDTRVGSLELRVPRVRDGSYRESGTSGFEERRKGRSFADCNVLALQQWGVPGLALCGTGLSPTTLPLLSQWKRLYAVLDTDEAGRETTASHRSVRVPRESGAAAARRRILPTWLRWSMAALCFSKVFVTLSTAAFGRHRRQLISRLSPMGSSGTYCTVVFKVSTAVQMRVTLQEIEPPVWRRLIVPRTFHLGELHQVIQAAFGWWDYHLHEFQIGGLSFSDPDLVKPEFEGDPRVYDERDVQLLDFSRGEDINFVYVYDFGDDWHHHVEFEQLLVVEPAPRLARCVDGARARPPEDVGGPHGHAEFFASLADRHHPEHADYKRWVGGHFDPEWFGLNMCDRDVRRALTANRPIRLRQPRRRRARSTSANTT